MEGLYIYMFYIVLTVILSASTYYIADVENKMVYSLAAIVIGAIISFGLWKKYGQYSITY